MIKAQVVTHWTVNDEGANVPHFVAMRGGDGWTDATAQAVVPNSPNSVVIECVVDDATFGEVENDIELYVLWDTPNPKPPNEPPSAAEWARQRVFMINQGYTTQQINEAIGQTPNGRNRNTIANDLIGWLRNR